MVLPKCQQNFREMTTCAMSKMDYIINGKTRENEW